MYKVTIFKTKWVIVQFVFVIMPRFLSRLTASQAEVPPVGMTYSMPAAGLQNSERKSLRISPTVGSTFKVNGNSAIVFRIPAFGFLKGDTVTVKGRFGIVHPAGALDADSVVIPPPRISSIVRRLRILSVGDQKVLEDIDSYNLINMHMLTWAMRASDSAIDNLIFGNNYHGSVDTIAEQANTGLGGFAASESNIGIEFMLKFHSSGILKADYWPLMATSGLQIEIYLERDASVLRATGSIASPTPGPTHHTNTGVYYVINNPELLYDVIMPSPAYMEAISAQLSSSGPGLMIPYSTYDVSPRVSNGTNLTEEITLNQKYSSIRALMMFQRDNNVVDSNRPDWWGLGHNPMGEAVFGKFRSELFWIKEFQIRIGSEMIPTAPVTTLFRGGGTAGGANRLDTQLVDANEFRRMALDFFYAGGGLRDTDNVSLPIYTVTGLREYPTLQPQNTGLNTWYSNGYPSGTGFHASHKKRHIGSCPLILDLQVDKSVMTGENTLGTQNDINIRITRWQLDMDSTELVSTATPIRQDFALLVDNVAIITMGRVDRLV